MIIVIGIVAALIIVGGAIVFYKSNVGARADKSKTAPIHVAHGPSVGRADGSGDN